MPNHVEAVRRGAMPPPAPGPHGGDTIAVARSLGIAPEDVADLSASLNPFAPDVATVVRRNAGGVARYPDDARATAVLGESIGVDHDRVVLTNGGAEAIALVAALQPVGWVEPPEFSLYERHLDRLDPTAPRWRSNPGNPTGLLAAPEATAGVWDEAFWPLATGTWTRGDDDAWRVGSLTKLWACPGLRLGYVIAPDADLAGAVRHRRPRWSVNALALAAVETLIDHTDLAAWSRSIAERRGELATMLRSHGLVVRDTEACWVLVEHPGLRDALLPYGVVVRDCASFGMADTFRVAVPDDRLAERLDLALRGEFG